MEQLVLSLASGLIGALLGAYVAIRINSDNRRVAAIENMLALVYPIAFKSWWQPDEVKPALIFQEKYPELWSAHAALRAALPFWKRKGLDSAWQKFMVIEYYDKIPEEQLTKVFNRGAHETREEAVEKSGEFQ